MLLGLRKEIRQLLKSDAETIDEVFGVERERAKRILDVVLENYSRNDNVADIIKESILEAKDLGELFYVIFLIGHIHGRLYSTLDVLTDVALSIMNSGGDKYA